METDRQTDRECEKEGKNKKRNKKSACMINFMNLLRRTEEEFFPSNVKKRKEERMSGNGLGSW